MATFKERVESYVGTQTQDLSQWLTDGAAALLRLLPDDIARRSAYNYTVGETGADIADYRILGATLDGRIAREIPEEYAVASQDTSSLLYAQTIDPAWYISGGRLYVVPAGSRKMIALYFPTISQDDEHAEYDTGEGSPPIIRFYVPHQYEDGVVLYTCVQVAVKGLASTLMDMSLSLPNAPSFTFTPISTPSIPDSAKYSIDLSSDLADLKTFIQTDEDLEKAQHQAEMITVKLQEFQAESSTYFQEIARNAELQKDTDQFNAAQALQRQVAEFSASVSRYTNVIQAKLAAVQAAGVVLTQMRTQYQMFLQLALGIGGKQDAAQ